MDELDAIEKEMKKESKDLKRTRFFAMLGVMLEFTVEILFELVSYYN